MALLPSPQLEFAPPSGADPLVTLQRGTERPLTDLRPGDSVELWLDGSAARGGTITLAGPSPMSFAVTSFSGGGRTRFNVVAEAPGAVRLAVMVHGTVLRDVSLVCRASALDGFARCERAREAHRTRLCTLQSFIGSVLAQLEHARHQLERAQHARMMEVQGLSEARALAVLLSDPILPEAIAPLSLLRAIWGRVTTFGVATRAIAILAPGELISTGVTAAPPTTLQELSERIHAAVAREERWVNALLETWPLRLQGMTARAPDRELAAGVVACSTDAAPLRAAYWRAWFYEHALAIRPGQAGAHAGWRTSRGLLEDVAAELPASWRATIAADVDAIAASANALGVL
jgi:hypothetical protein